MNWISINDRLPNYNEYVMTYAPCATPPIIIQSWINGYDDEEDEYWEEWSETPAKIKVTHWLPLPDVPKVE